MLVRCKECSQVVEVATLSEHLLMECEHKEGYTQCSQCSEAFKIDKYQEHATVCTGIFTEYLNSNFSPILRNDIVFNVYKAFVHFNRTL